MTNPTPLIRDWSAEQMTIAYEAWKTAHDKEQYDISHKWAELLSSVAYKYERAVRYEK